MPRSYSEDVRWRVIWIKEVLGFQVDDVASTLCRTPRTVQRYVSKFLNFGEVKDYWKTYKKFGYVSARGVFDHGGSA